jgi:hypothetical protein
MIALALLCLLGTTTQPAAAQSFEFTDFHTWTDLATIYNFSDSFRYDGDYGIRGLITDRDWTLIYVRPSVRYRFNLRLQLHGGAALFYNIFPGKDLPELRPWAGIRFVGPRPVGFTISNYFRLEMRAFYLKSTREWDAGFRGRWQLQVTSPRFNIGSAREFYALISIEPFFNIGSSIAGSFGNRFRYNMGIGMQVTHQLRIDLNYLFHQIRVVDQDGELVNDDHVVRLRFFYSFN